MSTTTEPPTELVPEAPIKGKGFAIRAVAWILDLIVLYVLFALGAVVAGLVTIVPLIIIGEITVYKSHLDGKVPRTIDIVAGLLLATAYGTLYDWLYGRTPAKLLLGMRVVKTDGSSLVFKEALIRALYRILDGFPFGGIAFLNMERPLYQRLGDKATGTLVVSSRDPIIRKAPRARRLLVATALYALFSGVLFEIVFFMYLW